MEDHEAGWAPAPTLPISDADYRALKRKQRCMACGERRTSEGQDPCIAQLPDGVRDACCGHGVQDGYVHFRDGRVIRGQWMHVRIPERR